MTAPAATPVGGGREHSPPSGRSGARTACSLGNGRLLLGVGVPFHRRNGRLLVEEQAVSGLKGWQTHFDEVETFAVLNGTPPPPGWIDAEEAGLAAPAFRFIPLPEASGPRRAWRSFEGETRTLRTAMHHADFIVISIGGWMGEWGLRAARIAREEGRAHALWFDRVESHVIAPRADQPLARRLSAAIRSRIIARNEQRVLAGADIALLHGATVFEGLGHHSPKPFKVENIHLRASDRIPPDRLAAKIARAGTAPLRIGYAGRADEMKGGLQWVETLARLDARGVAFEAEWAGDGTQLAEMKTAVTRAGLSDRVTFHGFVNDRARVLDLLRGIDLLMFCHLTNESPRLLIEALHSGTPLVGYDDAFARDLVGEREAGRLVPRGSVDALADEIATLAEDPVKLADLIRAAGASAAHLTYEEVFAERSRIVHTHLASRPA